MESAKPYSLTLLLHPQASAKEREEVETLVRGWIEQREGTVGTVTHDQKRRLAYPIMHTQQATYTTVQFSLAPQDMSDLRERLHRQKKLLRFVVFQQAPREGKGLKDIPLRPTMTDKTGGPAVPKKEKASLEKLDEKIGEILKEEVL
jgi:ribosomal protein S6